MNIQHNYPSNNSNNRPARSLLPKVLVLHGTGGAFPGCCEHMQNPAPGGDPTKAVSTHFVVTKQGVIEQQVDEHRRAWHAGFGSIPGMPGEDPNDVSLGIEFENLDNRTDPYTMTQLTAGIELCQYLVQKYNIQRRFVVTHQQIAPGRKFDPGVQFPLSWFLDKVFSSPRPPYPVLIVQNGLRVRSDKSTQDTKVLGSLNAGQTVYAREFAEGENIKGVSEWALITSGLVTGWISMRYAERRP